MKTGSHQLIVDDCWMRLGHLVNALLALLGGREWLAGPVWRRMAARIRLAEALTRRLVLLRAYEINVGPGRRKQSVSRPGGVGAEDAGRKRGFPIFDPLPDPYSALPAGGQTQMMAATVSAQPARCARALARRIAALQCVLQARDEAARRLRKWLDRRKCGRTTPLRPGRPPGLPGDIYDLEGGVLGTAHTLALEMLNAPP